MTVRMVEAGYASNVILSHDMTVFSRGMEEIPEEDVKGSQLLGSAKPRQNSKVARRG